MRVGVLGGSGRVGRLLIKELIERKHEVNALVRDINSLSEYADSRLVKIVEGSAQNKIVIEKTLAGCDAVISTLGHKNSSSNMQTVAMANVLSILKDKNKRLIVLTGAGVFFAGDKPKVFDKLTTSILKLVDPSRIKDAEGMCELIKNSDLHWTVVRTPVHFGQVSKGNYQVGLVGDNNLTWHTSRNLIAKFMVDCLESELYIRQAPVVTD